MVLVLVFGVRTAARIRGHSSYWQKSLMLVLVLVLTNEIGFITIGSSLGYW
jgi:hypothetical protein